MPKSLNLIDTRSLDAWISILSQARECGGKLDENYVWQGHTEGQLDNEENIDVLFKSLQNLRAYKEALNTIRMHLERRIIALQKKCKPLAFEDGIKRLPDEIVACIFECGQQATDDNKFALNVSHVCRRFREIAFGASQLWARFHPEMIHPEAVSFLESKSKQGGIEVFMSSHGDYTKDQQDQYRLIDVANRHIDRWTHLRMDGLIHMDDLFCETTPVLPRLRSIEHNNRFHNEYACPYEKWDMPNLSLFVGINVVPVFRVDCNISSLELILKGRSELNEYFHTSYLVDTLATLPRLRSLSLEFQATQCDEIRSSTASLPDLELLNITIKYSTDYTLIKSFISSVSFPNLSQLEILLEEICGEYSADGFLNEILPPFSAVHPRVHTVRIYTSHKFYIGLLQRVFDSVPSVRHLVIDAPNTALLWGNEFFVSAALYNRWPPLQTLRIKRSTRLSERQMEALVDKIHFDGNWDVFQSLQIVSCVGLSEGFLLYMESKMDGKLEWTNVVAAVDEPSENDFD